MNDHERVKRARACVQQALDLLAQVEATPALVQTLARLRADAELLGGLERRLAPARSRQTPMSRSPAP